MTNASQLRRTDTQTLLRDLDRLSDGDLRCAIQVALEYSDHPDVLRLRSGKLNRQLRLAIDELTNTED